MSIVYSDDTSSGCALVGADPQVIIVFNVGIMLISVEAIDGGVLVFSFPHLSK